MDNTLYRKYRPKSFSEIVGQDNIISILKKTILDDNPVHAYLFAGPKGTGKTTTARVFAKTLGCQDIDIFEIDAASSNSVEDIHKMNERLTHMPMSSKYSIYILDEVHMLSKSAFNAFLKTLEEPPKHIVFILATTEIEKLPETVYSRCQQHTFSKLTTDVVEDMIIYTAKKENYIIGRASAHLIALVSEGSLRDALSNLQKILLSTKDKEILEEDVEALLGIPKHKAINTYIESLVDADIQKGVNVLKEIKSTNMQIFADLVLSKLRVIILYKHTMNDDLLNGYIDIDKEFIKNMSKNEDISLDILKEIITARFAIKNSYIQRLPLEMAIVSRSYNRKISF